ncbi:MAG: alkaline phosphatase family protein [Sphingobacteriaceae bacterium]|nr:alkaline phosphatase family protein [Sphingobacteriaceae bacterium]
MKSILLPCAAILLFVNTTIAYAQKQPKVLMVIADGIPTDVIQRLQPPQLMKWAKQGLFAKAHVGGQINNYKQSPTISAPGYNHMLTGTWSYKHNVWDNDIKAPNYNYPSIFKLVQQLKPNLTSGIYSSWTDNRTKLIGESFFPQSGLNPLTAKADGYELDTKRFPHDNEKYYMHLIDEKVVDTAALILKNTAPTLNWLYLEYTDDMGHKHGDSHKLDTAVLYLDKQMQRIQNTIQYREDNFNEDWLVVLTTDHGRDAQTGKHHGGQSDRERATWIIANKTIGYNKQRTDTLQIVDILPTITDFLKIELPQNIRFELDGNSITKLPIIQNLQTNTSNQAHHLTWQALQPKNKLKVWITSTNLYSKGQPDSYTLIDEIDAAQQTYTLTKDKYPLSFYKLVFQNQNQVYSIWLGKP